MCNRVEIYASTLYAKGLGFKFSLKHRIYSIATFLEANMANHRKKTISYENLAVRNRR